MEIINTMVAFFKALIMQDSCGYKTYDLVVPLFRKYIEDAPFEDVRRVIDRFLSEPEKVREVVEVPKVVNAIVTLGRTYAVTVGTSGAEQKIRAIKEFRSATGYGLKDAKDCVESGHDKTVTFINQTRANEFAIEMRNAGCIIRSCDFDIEEE